MSTTLDLFEYENDALAQAAYVTDAALTQIDHATGSNIGDMTYRGGVAAAFDGNTDQAQADCAASDTILLAHGYVGKDWGSGVSRIISQYKIYGANDAGYDNGNVAETNTITIKLYGSNSSPADGTDGTLLHTANFINDSYSTNPKTYNTGITTTTAYRYHWVYMTVSNASLARNALLAEVELFSYALQSYSESTIKTQGSYSLKGVATTSALNKTLTRTIGSPIDLTGVDILKFDIRSTRTGSNIKIGIHDSGGTTSEKTHSVSSANTWELCVWDISAVADANKDAIDSIIVTIANADSANTFYIDNFLSAEDVTVTAEPIIVTTAMSSSGAVIFLGYGYVYEESSSGEAMDVSARTKASVGNTLLKRKNLKYIYHMMNTHGKDVTMTIYIDGTAHSHTFTINTTTRKMRRIEDVPNMEGYKFDIKLSCDDVTDTDLEIYAPIALHHTTYGE